MKTFLHDGRPMPTERAPVSRPNPFTPGSRKWAACEAANRLEGVFTEADILPVFVGVCHQCKLRPGSPERTIRGAVTELVQRGVLLRTGRQQLKHAH